MAILRPFSGLLLQNQMSKRIGPVAAISGRRGWRMTTVSFLVPGTISLLLRQLAFGNTTWP